MQAALCMSASSGKPEAAAVGPTCCSGREQRSNTAQAGDAIPPASLNTKAALRAALLARRRTLPLVERKIFSRRIAEHVSRQREFTCGARVALYLPIGSEVDTAPIVALARERRVHLFAPRIVHLESRRMRFVSLEHAHAGLRDSRRASVRFIAPQWLDLVLLPLVGFDSSGARLGMGAGFYDRALSFRRTRASWRGPRFIGLAFECQRVAGIVAQPWDIALDGVVSERGFEQLGHGLEQQKGGA